LVKTIDAQASLGTSPLGNLPVTNDGSPICVPASSDQNNNEMKSVISNAVQTITNWNALCDQGVNITMANDENIKSIVETNNQLKSKTNVLQSITATLKSKLAGYNLQ